MKCLGTPDVQLIMKLNTSQTLPGYSYLHWGWVIAPSSGRYDKSPNFSEVEFLLWRSGGQWIFDQMLFSLLHMTWGNWPWSRVNRKNLEIKVVFLLGKSLGVEPLTIFLVNLNIQTLCTDSNFKMILYIYQMWGTIRLPIRDPGEQSTHGLSRGESSRRQVSTGLGNQYTIS